MRPGTGLMVAEVVVVVVMDSIDGPHEACAWVIRGSQK